MEIENKCFGDIICLNYDEMEAFGETIKKLIEKYGIDAECNLKNAELTTYAVQSERNSYCSDEYCGTRDECMRYVYDNYISPQAKKYWIDRGYSDGIVDVKIAYIDIDTHGSDLYTREIDNIDDILNYISYYDIGEHMFD